MANPLDKDGYRTVKKHGAELFTVKLYLDKLHEHSIMEDSKGRKYVELRINQAKKKKGFLYAIQIFSPEGMKQLHEGDVNDSDSIVGEGFKCIEADYFLQESFGEEYMEYLFNTSLKE